METIKQERRRFEFWQVPGWYRALTLAERVGLSPLKMKEIASASAEKADRGQSRLRDWKEIGPFKDDAAFTRRLAQDGISEDELRALLAEPPESLKGRSPGMPTWLTFLREAFCTPAFREKPLPVSGKTLTDHPLAGCLPAIGPLLWQGMTALDVKIEALRQQHTFLPFDPEWIPQVFLENIGPELLFRMSRPVILEMHIARLQGRLQGETPDERFADFFRQLGQEEVILPLLGKYPVLARQLVTAIDLWANFLGEFLSHLCTDWPVICATFSPASDPGQLAAVQAGMGDVHRKGRSVLQVEFHSGLKLLYKPKPLAVDLHFQEFLSWLNEKGANPPFRILKLIERGEYGWSEFIAASPCSSGKEVARFYERQGEYLALLYALNAVDLHNENVIAAGEHPMLVDLEALFHPQVDGNDPSRSPNLASRAMDQSVWQVGLLPRRLWSDGDSPGVDMSGLGGQAGQMMPHALISWAETGSDQMRLVRQQVEMPVSQNRPQLNDRDVDVLDYRENILAGFTRMYRLLCEQRASLIQEQLPRFARDEIRVVIRSTRIYATLLFESFHPDLLRDALDRDRFFDYLWGEVEKRPYFARIISAERQDLLRGDIPLFTTTPESRMLSTSDKQPIEDFFDQPSLERARHQIRQLGEADLAKQVWIIEACLATLRMGREDIHERPLAVNPLLRPVDREDILALATAAGNRLDDLALQNETGAYWLGVNYVDEKVWSLFPTGIDLYNGTSGIALFLGYLGSITGGDAYTRLARRALASLRAQVDEQVKFSSDANIGAFDGLGSPIYLLTHLAVLWNDPALIQEAEGIAARLPALIPNDEHLDVINGSAGCILALLSLYSVQPSPRTLEIAVQCGQHLLATARPMPQGTAWVTLKDERPLGGFSHGTAGIAYSLIKLAAASGQARFRQTARAALAYDRSLFVPELMNWADLRVFPGRNPNPKPAGQAAAEFPPKAMVAWCHGAPGIGLGRLGAFQALDDASREDIEIALDTTAQYGVPGNHSLCHGALGNLELLLTAARILNRPKDREALARATAQVVGSIAANGWVSAVPLGVETPGLMTGLSGMGYELLRLAEPERVPSVLLLAPPVFHGMGRGAAGPGQRSWETLRATARQAQ